MKIKIIIGLILLAAVALLVFFLFDKNEHSGDSKTKTSRLEAYSLLDGIQNLDDFYGKDKTYDPVFLAEKKTYDKKVKSIKVYRFSSAYDSMLLEQELFFDFEGKLIKSAHYSIDYREPAFQHFFYNDAGKIFLDVSLGHNKYDTSYTLRNFDERNRIQEEIFYNIKRKELNSFVTRNYKTVSDSVLQIEETFYDHDLTTDNVLPYYIWNISLTLNAISEVECKRYRTVCQDTAYNSTDQELYRLENQKLISVKNDVKYEYNGQEDWVTMKDGNYLIKREFNFYADKEPEVKKDFVYSKAVLLQLDSIMQHLPATAWKNHAKRHNEISESTKLYNEGKYGKAIDIKEAKTIEAFTPVLWYLVSVDSGSITGMQGDFYVAGYNTPIQDEDGFNKRSLAIYERIGNTYKLRKQSLNALETFNDYDEDFSYHDFNEANFSVGIDEGEVLVSYGYMRGEAYYRYAFQNNDWFLVAYESNHRTCCAFESTSYNYRTETYKSSVTSTSEDESGDTSVTIHQSRPAVYMDSMNVMQYDYDETGLLVK